MGGPTSGLWTEETQVPMGAWVSNGLGYGMFSLVCCKFKPETSSSLLSFPYFVFNIFFSKRSPTFGSSSVPWLGLLLGLENFVKCHEISKGLVPENSRLAAEEGKLSKKTPRVRVLVADGFVVRISVSGYNGVLVSSCSGPRISHLGKLYAFI